LIENQITNLKILNWGAACKGGDEGVGGEAGGGGKRTAQCATVPIVSSVDNKPNRGTRAIFICINAYNFNIPTKILYG